MNTAEQYEDVGSGGSGPEFQPNGREGFTIIEVILAMVILAVGLLGMGGTTLLMVKQTTLADATTDRTVAMQTTIERLRALPFDSVLAGTDSIGRYDITWNVTTSRNRWKAVEVITVGPGLRHNAGFPALDPAVPDTFTYRILR